MTSSIWNDAAGFAKSKKWTHWPNPFNVIRNVRVLACDNDMWVADIEFYAKFAGEFWWTNFVPSPVEVLRKSFLGNYKCGITKNIPGANLGEIMWGANTQRMIAGIFAPVLNTLFYWWATETAVSALSAWSTLLYEQARCENQDMMAVMRGGHFFSHLEGPGSPAGSTVVKDPFGLCVPADCAISKPSGVTSVTCALTFLSTISEPVIVTAWLEGVPYTEQHPQTWDVTIPGLHSMCIEGYSQETASIVQPRIKLSQSVFTGGNIEANVGVFTMTRAPNGDPDKPKGPSYADLPHSCE